MSAMYYIWKNYDISDETYVGLRHYRRRLEFSMMQIEGSEIITSYPYICPNGALKRLQKNVSSEFAALVRQCLHITYPSMVKEIDDILDGEYYYPYNLFIMRGDIFNEYCHFMFENLFYIEQEGYDMEEVRRTDALSRAAEILTTVFFRLFCSHYTIKHTSRRIFV
jgi:hypothetical protein